MKISSKNDTQGKFLFGNAVSCNFTSNKVITILAKSSLLINVTGFTFRFITEGQRGEMK